MIRTIIETNVLLYVMAAAGMLGILGQLLLNRHYRAMLKEASGVQSEKPSFMKRLIWRYQTDCKRSDGQVNVALFVRRSLMDCRFWRMSPHRWKRFCGGMYLISMILGVAGAACCRQMELSAVHMERILQMGATVTAVSLLTAVWLDVRYKERCLQTMLENYLTHSGVGRTYVSVDMETAAEAELRQSAEDSAMDAGALSGQKGQPGESETGTAVHRIGREYEDENRALEQTAQTRVKKAPSIVGMRRKKEPTGGVHAQRQKPAQETRAQKDKRELQENLARIREGTRETAAELEKSRERNREILRQMDSREQERIIRDVLAEFLA